MQNAQNAAERDQYLVRPEERRRRHGPHLAEVLMLDGTVPRSRLAETLARDHADVRRRRLRVLFVFHAGDGNMHPHLVDDPGGRSAGGARHHYRAGRSWQLLASKAAASPANTASACEKRSYMPLMFNLDELWAMQDVKDVFDPDHLLNPGKIIPNDLEPRPAVPAATIPAPAGGVVAPRSFEEAVEVVRAMAQETSKRTLRIQGAGTKSGHMPAADVTLSTANMCGIKSLSIDDLCVTVAAGTPLSELQEQLAQHKLFTPLVSPWPEATVGGIVASGANARSGCASAPSATTCWR